MPLYQVTIREIQRRVMEIQAENEEDARERVLQDGYTLFTDFVEHYDHRDEWAVERIDEEDEEDEIEVDDGPQAAPNARIAANLAARLQAAVRLQRGEPRVVRAAGNDGEVEDIEDVIF